MSAPFDTSIPAIAELAAQGARFVTWRYEQQPNGKLTKVPYRVFGNSTAESDNPKTWGTIDQAIARFNGGGRDGIGYVPGDGIVVIDLDVCIDPTSGEIADWAQEIVDNLDSYTEISPSGSGLKIYTRTTTAPFFVKKVVKIEDAPRFRDDKDPQIEILEKLYTTVTGRHFGGAPREIRDATDALVDLAQQMASIGGAASEQAQTATPSIWPAELLMRAAETIPNDDLPWPEWKAIGMRFWAAESGADGFAAFDAFSAKSQKHDPRVTRDEWAHIATSPPTKYNAESLLKEARKADPSFPAPPDPLAAHGAQVAQAMLAKIAAAPVKVSDLSEAPPAPRPAPADLAAPMFYGPLGDVVRKIDPRTEADPRGVMTCLLVMLGNWIGRRYFMLAGADRHFPAQQAILIGKSALARKGTAGNLAKAAMECFDPEWAGNNVFYALNSGQGIAHTISERVKAGGDKRALFRVDEFADVLKKARGETNTLLQTLRVAWDGGTLENTSASKALRVDGATVSMIGMITESELRDLVDPAQLATGSYNRLNFCLVERSKALPGHPPPITSEHLAGMVALREAIDGLPLRFGGNLAQVESIPTPITLSAAASEMAIDLKDRWELEGENWVEQANTRSYVHILRYALIYAIADASTAIEPAHLTAAEDLVRYFAQGIERQATGALSDKIAQRILTHMREAPDEALSRSDINNAVFHRNVSARDLENGISQLEELGMIQSHKVETGGRPRTMYALAEWARTP